MQQHINYFAILQKRLNVIVVVMLGVIFIGIIVTALQTPKFRASVQLLVVEEQVNHDAYAAIRSAEKINTSLTHIIITTSFAETVLANASVQRQLFPQRSDELQTAWQQTVIVQVVPETGLLKIDVYHADPNQAVAIAKSISQVLATNAQRYTGSPLVKIERVDGPISSPYAVKPNILLNVLASVALGTLLAVGYVLLTTRAIDEAAIQATESELKIPVLVNSVDESDELTGA